MFEQRVYQFIKLKKFIYRGSKSKATEKMKVLIAACAIQLVFGYPHVYFEHFKLILIYPDNYYSSITKKYHQGEVNKRGIIVLSWSNFLLGIENQSDGINLGLHEMAHALHLENFIYNSNYAFIDDHDMHQFKQLASIESERLNKEEDGFFRKYGAKNLHEFFAVIVENFFERPVDFQDYHPQLFHLTRKILNQ